MASAILSLFRAAITTWAPAASTVVPKPGRPLAGGSNSVKRGAGVIDRRSRDVVAELIRRFRDGQITNEDLITGWPAKSPGPALRAIETMVWPFYDDLRTHRLVGRHALTPEASETLSRYALFLDTDLPYEWRRTRFARISSLGWLPLLTLGLLWPLDRWVRRRKRR